MRVPIAAVAPATDALIDRLAALIERYEREGKSLDDLDAALAVAAKHGCFPLRGVATYEDIYKLTYVRGPSGIIVMLAEELNKR